MLRVNRGLDCDRGWSKGGRRALYYAGVAVQPVVVPAWDQSNTRAGTYPENNVERRCIIFT